MNIGHNNMADPDIIYPIITGHFLPIISYKGPRKKSIKIVSSSQVNPVVDCTVPTSLPGILYALESLNKNDIYPIATFKHTKFINCKI